MAHIQSLIHDKERNRPWTKYWYLAGSGQTRTRRYLIKLRQTSYRISLTLTWPDFGTKFPSPQRRYVLLQSHSRWTIYFFSKTLFSKQCDIYEPLDQPFSVYFQILIWKNGSTECLGGRNLQTFRTIQNHRTLIKVNFLCQIVRFRIRFSKSHDKLHIPGLWQLMYSGKQWRTVD